MDLVAMVLLVWFACCLSLVVVAEAGGNNGADSTACPGALKKQAPVKLRQLFTSFLKVESARKLQLDMRELVEAKEASLVVVCLPKVASELRREEELEPTSTSI